MKEEKTELEQNAINEDRRQHEADYQLAMARQLIESHVATGAMTRCIALLHREEDIERQAAERTDRVAEINEITKKDVNMAAEIAQVKKEEMTQLLRRHYLWERDPGLRELVRKLKNGYTSRDLQAQIKYNEYKKLQDKVDAQQGNVYLNECLDVRGTEAADRLAHRLAYRHELQEQLVAREQKRQCKYEDTLVERKMIEEVMKTIHDEDVRALEEARRRSAAMQRDMRASATAQRAWRELERRSAERTERDLERQRAALSDRAANIIADRNARMQAKADFADQMCAKIVADEAEKLSRINILASLQEQEALEKLAIEDEVERGAGNRTKAAQRRVLEAQMQDRARLAREEAARDVEARKQTEEYTRIENEKELNKQRLDREKRQKYAAELKQQMAENEILRQQKKERDNARVQNVWNYRRNWDKEVNEERSKTIEEHAPRVLGFLSVGVLRPEDMTAVAAGARRDPQLGQMDLDLLVNRRRQVDRRDKCNPQCMMLREY